MASYSKRAIQEFSVKSSILKVSQISFMKENQKDNKSFELKYYPWTGEEVTNESVKTIVTDIINKMYGNEK